MTRRKIERKKRALARAEEWVVFFKSRETTDLPEWAEERARDLAEAYKRVAEARKGLENV